MTRSSKNPKVDAFLRENEQWRQETKKLRAIALDCGLTEELKWGKPAYSFLESNVLIIQGFKQYCALMFCKGVLLKDAKGILVAPGENSQSARQARFTHVREIVKLEDVLKAYIREAIAAEVAGVKVAYKKPTDFIMPEEFQNKLEEIPALRTAFEALTPGRQRAYYLYFSAAKQSKTRASRIEKCVPQILNGKGLSD